MAGIYIHIPFCKQACSYCNYHFSTQLNRRDEMVSALIQEIEERKAYLNGEAVTSIYFGGGTPSLLSHKSLDQLFESLFKNFTVSKDAEITLEANPDDLTKEKLKELIKTPINRLSIGVQSFLEEDLRFMNRAHSAEEALKSIQLSQDIGFNQLNIDLIYGSQSTTDSMWAYSLEQFFKLKIPHLSAYTLTIEEKTALEHQIKSGITTPLDDGRNYRQYEMLQAGIKANNFEQYELSNYCVNEQYAKHNTAYWQGKEYLGIGPSAHSFNGHSRQWNISNNALFIKAVEENKPYFEIENLSEIDQYHEFLITSLRTKWGLSLKDLEKFSPSINKHFLKQIKSISADTINLTSTYLKVKPSYFFQSDEVIRTLMIAQ